MAAVSPLASPQDAAFAGLYERHAGRVFAYCRRSLRSREEAEEAAQTTFFHAWRSLGRGVEPTFETAWLLTIARNVCRNSSSVPRREVAADPHLLEDTLEAPEAPPELEGLRQALASLTDQQRQALLLREWQGLTYSEIAAEMGLSQSAVETLLFRARRSLAARLRRPLSIGSLLPWVKSAFGGAAAVVAVTATSVAVMHGDGRSTPAPARHHRAVAPAQHQQQQQQQRHSTPSVATPVRAVHTHAAQRHVVRGGAPPRTVVPPAVEAPSAPPPPTATTTETATPPAAAASPPPAPAAPVTQTVQDTVQDTVQHTVQGVVDTVTQTAGDVVNTVTTATAPVLDTVTSAVPTVPTVPTVTTPALPTLP